MQQCRKCRVNVDGDKGRCPLCQGELTGERERDMFPRIAEPRFGSEFLIKLISFIAISAIVICAATDYLLSGRLSWSGAVPDNSAVGAVGQVHRLAWLVTGLRSSVCLRVCNSVHFHNRKGAENEVGRIYPLPYHRRILRASAADMFVCGTG